MIGRRCIQRIPLIRRRTGERGQGLVEFSMLVPLFLILLLGMLEFGTAFNHQLTLGYATREGARIGADLVNGGGALGCGTGQSPNAANVDQIIVEAVGRVLTSAGSPIPLGSVTKIRIFQADQNGGDTLGKDNDWVYTASLNTMNDGAKVNFTPGTQAWNACNRSNVVGHTYTNAVDSIGVSISYTYQMTTPLASALRLVGGGGASTLPMTDATVMQLNPTSVTN
jgi:Flp pilus assembly protein TadG